MPTAADWVVALVCLGSAAFVTGIGRLIRGGDTSLISGYTPGALPPEQERVLARRARVVALAGAAYTALGAPLALLGLSDDAWLAWSVGFLLLLPPAYAIHPERWPPG